MLAHGFTWLKLAENTGKWEKIAFPSYTQEAYKRLTKKNEENSKWATSIWVSPSFWESLPNRWPTNFFFIFLRFSSCALHEPIVQMMKKILFYSFSTVFDCFRPCERVRKHVFAGWNTQQIGFSDHKLECVYAIKYFFSGIPIAIFTSSIQWVKIA